MMTETSTSSAEKEKDSQPNIDCDTNRGKCDNGICKIYIKVYITALNRFGSY